MILSAGRNCLLPSFDDAQAVGCYLLEFYAASHCNSFLPEPIEQAGFSLGIHPLAQFFFSIYYRYLPAPFGEEFSELAALYGGAYYNDAFSRQASIS